jgi:hypothetical protein
LPLQLEEVARPRDLAAAEAKTQQSRLVAATGEEKFPAPVPISQTQKQDQDTAEDRSATPRLEYALLDGHDSDTCTPQPPPEKSAIGTGAQAGTPSGPDELAQLVRRCLSSVDGDHDGTLQVHEAHIALDMLAGSAVLPMDAQSTPEALAILRIEEPIRVDDLERRVLSLALPEVPSESPAAAARPSLFAVAIVSLVSGLIGGIAGSLLARRKSW